MSDKKKAGKKFFSNLLQQNCYVRENVSADDLLIDQSQTMHYYELVDTVNVDGDSVERLKCVEYPITPEYVASFALSSDYRTDLQGAIAQSQLNSGKRVNLGDVTAFQEFMKMDTNQRIAFMQKNKDYIDAFLKTYNSVSSNDNNLNNKDNNGGVNGETV